MAWFEVDIFRKCVEVDLHNYSTAIALATTREKIEEAYEHGFRHIRLIHGAASISNRTGGGSIKFALRAMLKSGELDKWIDRKGSRVGDGSMVLELRKNPVRGDMEWNEMPPEDYFRP